jgi:hypothetical protein
MKKDEFNNDMFVIIKPKEQVKSQCKRAVTNNQSKNKKKRMDYEAWYKNLSIRDKSQERNNLETIMEDKTYSKIAKQIAQKKLSRIK